MSLKMVELPKNERCAACGTKCVGAHWHYGGARLPPAGRDGRVKFCGGSCCPLPICQELAAKAEDLEWDDEDEEPEWDDVEWDEPTSKDEDELDWADVPD